MQSNVEQEEKESAHNEDQIRKVIKTQVFRRYCVGDCRISIEYGLQQDGKNEKIVIEVINKSDKE